MQVEIVKMDHKGNGIGYIDGKVIFVPKTIPDDIVEVKITKEKKNYLNGQAIIYVKRCKECVNPFCKHYYECDGCQLQNMSYQKTLDYKTNRIKNILQLDTDITIIENKTDKHYRNKIELKIKNYQIGYFQEGSHNIVEISQCPIAMKSINNVMPLIKSFNIKDADVIIRSNYNNELLISINSNSQLNVNENILPDYKVCGIILNNKCIYGSDHFIDKIDNMFFNVSYDAFFQVNSFINSKLFDIIKENVKGKKVLDLYSGVGTLSIVSSKTAEDVFAIEVNENATKNALLNAKMNNVNNVNFILGKVEDKIEFINGKIDTVIVDPPRKGLDNKTINHLLKLKPNNIIYISCDTQSLKRDLDKLNYKIKKIYMLDMFSYTYHIETVCILERS